MTNSKMRSLPVFFALSTCAACASMHSTLDDEAWTQRLSVTASGALHWSPTLLTGVATADATTLVWSAGAQEQVLSIPLPFDDGTARDDASAREHEIVLLHPGEQIADVRRRTPVATERARLLESSSREHERPIFLRGTYVGITRLVEEALYWEELANGVTFDLLASESRDDRDPTTRRSRVNACFGPVCTTDGMLLGLQISF